LDKVESFKKNLGKRIKQLRLSFKNAKLTQDDLADNLESVSRANLSRIENGEVMASAIFIKEVSEFFNTTADWLLTGEAIELSQTVIDTDLKRLIETYHLLDNESRPFLEAYAAFLLSNFHQDILGQALSKKDAPYPISEPDVIKEEKKV